MQNGFPIKVLTAAMALTMVFFVGVGWYVWDSYQAFKAMQSRDFRLQELSGRISSLGEALTMSAHMGVATGDPQWEERYQRFWPQLYMALREAMTLAPETYFTHAAAEMNAASVKLAGMETRAFALVRQGRQDAAVALLASEAHKEQKQLYTEGTEQVTAVLKAHVQANLDARRRLAFFAIAATGVVLPSLLFAWLGALRLVRRHVAAASGRRKSYAWRKRRPKRAGNWSNSSTAWPSRCRPRGHERTGCGPSSRVPTRWPVSTASTSCSPRPTARVSSWWRRTVRNPLRGLPLSPAAGPFYQAFQTRRPVAVLQDEDLQQILPLDPIYRDHPFFRSQLFVIAPLVVGDRAVGAVCVDNKTSRRRSVLQASSPLPCSVSSSPGLGGRRAYTPRPTPGSERPPQLYESPHCWRPTWTWTGSWISLPRRRSSCWAVTGRGSTCITRCGAGSHTSEGSTWMPS